LDNWPKHSTNWGKLGPPLKPANTVIDKYKELVPNGRIMMLGVTPEIYSAFDNILAVDHNLNMITNVWLGDTDTKKAIVDDWITYETTEKFDGIVGDIALTLMGDKDTITNFTNKSFNWLNSNGVMAQRIFHSPTVKLPYEYLVLLTTSLAPINWHAYKWLLHIYLATSTKSQRIKQSAVRDLFNQICPDRNILSQITGWHIDTINTIDFYENATQEVTVLSKDDWLDTIPVDAVDVEFVYTEGYDICNLFPILKYRHV
jgi:hypothetical protein